MTGSLSATAADSLASGNVNGFEVASSTGKAAAVFTLVNNKATNNQVGVLTSVNGTMFLNASTVSGNSGFGFARVAGVLNSYGNNAITDTATFGTLTSVALR